MYFTERQEYELLAAISARGEIPVKFGYIGEGAARWDAFYRGVTAFSSAVTNEEAALMDSHIESFIQSFGNTKGINLIDLGCGNGLPAIAILKKLRAKKLAINYMPVDLSQEMLAIASKNVKKALPNIAITELWIDFESENLASKLLGLKQKSKLPNLLINLGNTLGNYVNVSSVLTNFLQSMTLEDYLIIGNGLVNDQNSQKILRAYDSDILKRDATLPAQALGLFTDKDSYEVLWNSSQHRVEIRIKLSQDRQLSLAGQVINLASGDEILVLKSHKYTEFSLTKLLSNVGFRSELLTTNRNQSYILAMIQPTRYSAS
jgi:uncharacterized SAM-dependent methyltransferase